MICLQHRGHRALYHLDDLNHIWTKHITQYWCPGLHQEIWHMLFFLISQPISNFLFCEIKCVLYWDKTSLIFSFKTMLILISQKQCHLVYRFVIFVYIISGNTAYISYHLSYTYYIWYIIYILHIISFIVTLETGDSWPSLLLVT